MEKVMSLSNHNYFQQKYESLLQQGVTGDRASEILIHAYLDNKPANSKLSPSDKHSLFWYSDWVNDLPTECYQTELFVLALAKYFSQDTVCNSELMVRVARISPEVIVRSVRYAGIVLHGNALKWQEVEAINRELSGQFDELLELGRIFQEAYNDRLRLVKNQWLPLKNLGTLEILCYSSLFAFHQLMEGDLVVDGEHVDQQSLWQTMGNIIQRPLQTAKLISFRPTEADIGKVLKKHLSPILFPGRSGYTQKAFERYFDFCELFFAQLELDRFLSQSVDAYCYDDSIQFKAVNGIAELKIIDPQEKTNWQDGNNKLLTLYGYWFNRGFQAFEASEMSRQVIGSVENHESNALAVIKSLGATMELEEIYGIGDTITTDNNFQVNTYQALLASHLMTAFFKQAYIDPYQNSLSHGLGWTEALQQLALDGLIEGMQSRLPFTWSTDEDKARNIRGWTVTDKHPKGSISAAKAILDFWTADLSTLAQKLKEAPGLQLPELHERPFLKMGRYSFQVPWVMAFQNNTTAAINNLRRIGSHRNATRSETGRIEQNLAKAFEDRGF